jgi:hypothetical protein
MARSAKLPAIKSTLKDLDLDIEEFDSSLYENEDLKQYLAAFSGDINKQQDFRNLVRAYTVGGLEQADGVAWFGVDMEDEIGVSVKQLFGKYRVHSGNPEEEEIEGTSVWLPKDKISEEKADNQQITRAIKSLIKDGVPKIGNKGAYAGLAAENFHFRNSDDGQGLSLYHITTDDNGVIGSYPVGDKNRKPISFSWDDLLERIEEQRGTLEKPISPLEVLIPALM